MPLPGVDGKDQPGRKAAKRWWRSTCPAKNPITTRSISNWCKKPSNWRRTSTRPRFTVGAYPVTPINIAIELPDFDPSVYNDAIRGQHLIAMKALRQKFCIKEEFTHVEKACRKR